jgi:hypothetical protein
MADDRAFLSATELLKRHRDESLSPVAIIRAMVRGLVGALWSSPALTAALAKVARSSDASVNAKIKPRQVA